MKKGNKKSSIIDRAKSNIEKNRKDQETEKFLKVFLKYLNTFRGRFGLLVLFTTIGFIAILGKVYSIQTKGGNKLRDEGEKQYSSKSFTKAKRGKISTSDGQVLAYDNEQFIINLDPSLIEEKNISIEEFSVEPENIGKLIKLIKANTISSKIAKDVFEILLSENKDPEIIVKEKGLVQITDNSEIEKIVEQVLAENPQSVEDYKAGKSNALKYLVGQSMRLSKGKANPQMINEMILARLEG